MNGCAARPLRWCTSRETCAYNVAHHHVGCCACTLCGCGCEEESAQCRKWFGFGKLRYMHVLFCLFFGDHVRVHVAAHAGGETDLATRGARCTQTVSCAHVCVCARQLLCFVCLCAPRDSRLLGRIALALHVLLGSRVCACLFVVFC